MSDGIREVAGRARKFFRSGAFLGLDDRRDALAKLEKLDISGSFRNPGKIGDVGISALAEVQYEELYHQVVGLYNINVFTLAQC